MYTRSAAKCVGWSVLVTAAVACTLFADSVAAAGHEFIVAFRVSTKGLDLSQLAGAQRFYQRLQYAAGEVCKPDVRVALEPVADPKGCMEKALADAIRSANQPLLTQVYLETHTLQEAAARGIEVAGQVAAK
jgi:UrcA family protein